MRSFNLRTVTAIVIGNMIGAGVFTTLGIQLEEIQRPFTILLAWLIGGVIAFCGAIAYANLARHFPRSGGEYHFMTRIYGQPLGFAAGLISILIGFAAPLALTASAFGHYFQHFIPISPRISGVILIGIFSIVHAWHVRTGGEVHFGVTALKLLLIGVFIIAGLTCDPVHSTDWAPDSAVLGEIVQPGFFLVLLFAGFAYSGWNASCYVIDEIKDAEVNVGRSLFIGTALVTAIYLLLNFVFLYATPISDMQGQVEVALSAGKAIFGENGGLIAGAMITLALVSSISALIIAGSRVVKVMAEDYPVLKNFARENKSGAPTRAIVLQSGLAVVFLLSFTFETILTYTSFTLAVFAFLTALGNVILRRRIPTFTLSPGQSIAVWIFLFLSTSLIIYVAIARPVEALASLLFAGICYGLSWIAIKR